MGIGLLIFDYSSKTNTSPKKSFQSMKLFEIFDRYYLKCYRAALPNEICKKQQVCQGVCETNIGGNPYFRYYIIRSTEYNLQLNFILIVFKRLMSYCMIATFQARQMRGKENCKYVLLSHSLKALSQLQVDFDLF